jgi:hypothetical protein
MAGYRRQILWTLIGILLSPSAEARLFARRRSHCCTVQTATRAVNPPARQFTTSSVTPASTAPVPPVQTAQTIQVYRAEPDGKHRVLQRIRGRDFVIVYSKEGEGTPSAQITHVASGGRMVPITSDFRLESTPSVTMQFPDGTSYAFLFQDHQGSAYAQLLKNENTPPFWVQFAQNVDVQGARKWRALSEHQIRSALADNAADRIEAHFDEHKNDPQVLAKMRHGGAAFSRFLHGYRPHLPQSLPSRQEIFARSSLPRSPRGGLVALEPDDVGRPGVVITADDAHFEEMDKVVETLRNKTTATLLARSLFRRQDKKYVETMRANSFIVAKPGHKLTEAIAEANRQLSELPKYVAGNAVVEAERQTGNGPLANAQRRVERAASGGLGARQFNEGLQAGLPKAMDGGRESLEQSMHLIARRTEQMAHDSAERIQERAREVNKPAGLVGFEIDVLDQRPMGIEYTVTTDDGGTHFIKNLGRNFQNPNGPYVPAQVYARFNVSVLEAYEKGRRKISRDELFRIAAMYQFKPSAGGELVYTGPISQE